MSPRRTSTSSPPRVLTDPVGPETPQQASVGSVSTNTDQAVEMATRLVEAPSGSAVAVAPSPASSEGSSGAWSWAPPCASSCVSAPASCAKAPFGLSVGPSAAKSVASAIATILGPIPSVSRIAFLIMSSCSRRPAIVSRDLRRLFLGFPDPCFPWRAGAQPGRAPR